MTVAAVGVLVYLAKKSRVRKELHHVADAGYETAHDILFPMRGQRSRRFWQ